MSIRKSVVQIWADFNILTNFVFYNSDNCAIVFKERPFDNSNFLYGSVNLIFADPDSAQVRTEQVNFLERSNFGDKKILAISNPTTSKGPLSVVSIFVFAKKYMLIHCIFV